MESDIHDKIYIRRCLELASKGLGKTGLNPLVGSVIVHENRIIGEGYHREFGGPHAEVNAINSVREPALLKDSTIYVNLEPCSHYGKTPPCSLLIMEKKIPRLVISMVDPNPEVSGRGIGMLKKAGVNVVSGLLEEEARFLNRRFIVNQVAKRPYVILKWAESRDGFIDKIRKPGDPLQPNWITNETARMLVHKWRSEETAITAGVNTILTDNPSLNLRSWAGTSPFRIIVDINNRISGDSNVMDDSVPTLIFSTRLKQQDKKNTVFHRIRTDYKLEDLLLQLLELGISSLIVEGGAILLNKFINSNLWDEARIFQGRKLFYEGIKAPVIEKKANFFEVFCNHNLSIWVKGIT